MSPTRAINEQDKLKKREAILNAAQALWVSNDSCISKMDELARKSGLAKGTLYLYFRSKDEVLLALHERDMLQFFERLITRAQQPDSMTPEEFIDIFIDSIQSSPTFLPLASYCHGLMEKQIPQAVALAFKVRMSQHIDLSVKALKPHLSNINHLLMTQGYGLTLGLWQLLKPSPLNALEKEQGLFIYADPALAAMDFTQILRQSLLALYQGALLSHTASH